MKKILLALFLVVAIGLNLAGCSVGGDNSGLGDSGAVSSGTGESSGTASSKPEEEKKINEDFLSEFGKTFKEIQGKYGNVIRSRVEGAQTDKYYVHCINYYYFEKGKFEYGFTDDAVYPEALPESAPISKLDAIFNRSNLQVKDVFLGMDKAVSVSDFKEAYGIKFDTGTAYNPDDYTPIIVSSIRYEDCFGIIMNIYHDKEDIIEPTSALTVFYDPVYWPLPEDR